MKNQDNQTMEIDVLSLVKSLWRRKFLIVVTAFVMAIITLGYNTFIIKPNYTSSTRIYVVNRQPSDNSTLTNQDLQAGSYLVKDYKEIILSQDVLAKVISDLDYSCYKSSRRDDIRRSRSTKLSFFTEYQTQYLNWFLNWRSLDFNGYYYR